MLTQRQKDIIRIHCNNGIDFQNKGLYPGYKNINHIRCFSETDQEMIIEIGYWITDENDIDKYKKEIITIQKFIFN